MNQIERALKRLLNKKNVEDLPGYEATQATITFSAAYPALYVLASEARKVLGDYDPPNYMAFNFKDKDGNPEVELFVRRANGITLTELVEQLKKELRISESTNEALRACLRAHMTVDHPAIEIVDGSFTTPLPDDNNQEEG